VWKKESQIIKVTNALSDSIKEKEKKGKMLLLLVVAGTYSTNDNIEKSDLF